MMQFKLGEAQVKVTSHYTITRFTDGRHVVADHESQPGQELTAHELGYPSAEHMNRDHDLCHSILAAVLGLDFSPTLRDVADRQPASDTHYHEEKAVLALQRLATHLGIDLVEVARRLSVNTGESDAR